MLLSKVLGKKVKDIEVSITYEFGDPTIQLCKLILEDGSYAWCEGEHDMSYLAEGSDGSMPSDEALEKLQPRDE